MRRATELIIQNAGRFPEFRYYISIMKKAERNLSNQPDICIETCKSVLEGVSKSIIERLDQTANREVLDNKEVGPLIKQAARLLKQNENVIEDDFVSRCSSLAYALATLRNERGDISHGKAVPKSAQSNDSLSTLSMEMTDGIVFYMLDAFFRMSQLEPPPAEVEKSPEGDADTLEIIPYEESEDFNLTLDEEYPLDGKLFYSFALYELYYEDYVIRLSAYKDALEATEE